MGQPLITDQGITSNFDSQWQRTMKKALATTSLGERFTEHDLKNQRPHQTQKTQNKHPNHCNITTHQQLKEYTAESQNPLFH